MLRYADPQRGRRRLIRLHGEGREARLQALLLVGDGAAADGLRALWQDGLPVADYGRQLLSANVAPSGVACIRGRQICNCFDVSEPRIRAFLDGAAGSPVQRLASVQAELKCGTQCGSCLPELRRLAGTARTGVELASR